MVDVMKVWKKMEKFPGGKLLFSKFMGNFAPYSGTMGAHVDVLEPGHAILKLRDRRTVRNHLKSVHAAALMNFGELCSGLAFITALKSDQRGILKSFTVEYLKKARGLLTAEARCTDVPKSGKFDFIVEARITNEGGEVVALARATWLGGPVS